MSENVAYRVLCADPPWVFRDKLPGKTRGAERNYRVLSTSQIEQFPLPPIADDAVLFLWRVASQGEEGYRVIRAWGFIPDCEMVWEKLTVNGKRHFGMGRTVRASHELCLIGKRGKPTRKAKNVRSLFEAPIGRRHSEKPEIFYELVERLYEGPYSELFARRQRPGWTCQGDEIAGSQPIRSH